MDASTKSEHHIYQVRPRKDHRGVRMLRHADIRVTAQHYLDTKERTPIGLGNLLATPMALQ